MSVFTDKVAFVTGAGSGIGRATALAFANSGADVVVADVAEEANRDTARQVEELGGRSLAVACDVTRDDEIEAALEQTIATFGRLDAAFNNAGVEQSLVPAADISIEEWERIIAVNLRGVFLCMKHEIPLMLGPGWRRDREHGLRCRRQRFPYLRCLRRLEARRRRAHAISRDGYAHANLRINAVCPGITDTAMMGRVTGGTDEGRQAVIAQEPIGRMGTPEEIAATVLWLCSEASSFVVGSALVVDGGQTA